MCWGSLILNVTVDRDAAARYQINVADVQDAVQTAVGGNALTQVLKDEARYDLTLRYLPQYRSTQDAIEIFVCCLRPGAGIAGAALQDYDRRGRFGNLSRRQSTYVAIKYSVRGRDLGGCRGRRDEKSGSTGEAAARLSH